MLMKESYDVVIIGGGVNGCGIARDLAGRGHKVLLLEKGDIAGATSSASSKLIHGGLRYLESYDFNLVRKALIERDNLINIAPHIIWPMRFILPHNPKVRARLLVRLGLFCYDALRYLRFPPKLFSPFKNTRTLNLKSHDLGKPLKNTFKVGFEYSDAWVQDSRLSVLNAMDAAAKGADIFTRSAFTKAEHSAGGWRVHFTDHKDRGQVVSARLVVNAAGPWADKIAENIATDTTLPTLHKIRGSHLVVPQIFGHDRAYIVQNNDGRIVFFTPYEDKFTLIGTTDEPHKNGLNRIEPAKEEEAYLLKLANRTFKAELTENDIFWRFAGVRALADGAGEGKSASKLSRDYELILDQQTGEAPSLHIYGGKLTTYRKLAEDVAKKLNRWLLSANKNWTAQAPLPGGDFSHFDVFLLEAEKRFPWLPKDLAYRFARNYGTRLYTIIGGAESLEDMGTHFGDNLYEAEVRYLLDNEFARSARDILWRRTKLGLHIKADTAESLQTWLDNHN